MQTMEEQFQLDNFNLETELINEQTERKTVELSQFDLETQLIEKGVL
jgi:hypothetical protein